MKKLILTGFFLLTSFFLLYPASISDLLVEDGVLASNHQCITVYSHPWHGFGDGYHFLKGSWSDLSPDLLNSHTYEKFTTATPQQLPQLARMVGRLYQVLNLEPLDWSSSEIYSFEEHPSIDLAVIRNLKNNFIVIYYNRY